MMEFLVKSGEEYAKAYAVKSAEPVAASFPSADNLACHTAPL